MSLKCSLLGHEFGPVERAEDREERTDEVVVTTREVQACERCGRQRVLSENKEVTAIEDERGTEPASAGQDAPAGSATDPDAAEPTASVGDPWESVEDTPNATAHIESVGDSPDASPEGEDAEIIESDPEATTGPPGRTPEPAPDPEPDAATDDGSTDGPSEPDDTEWAEASVRRPGQDMEYVCPECEWSRDAKRSSLRPGDVCPECRTGYLEERAAERNR